jgi:hypothetical protein
MMRRFTALAAILLVPALGLFLASSSGCKKGDDKGTGDTKATGDGKKAGDDGAKKGARTALEASHDGVVKGKVVFDGEPPKMDYIEAMKKHDNKKGCLAGADFEQREQKWIVNPKNKGVANVVVSLQPPKGMYFELSEDERTRSDSVVLDQPHCAFVPHVVALFPQYYDGKDYKKTGQKLLVKNSAEFTHNTKITPGGLKNTGRSPTIPPQGKFEVDLNYESAPLQIGCDIHSWMYAIGLLFEHPFFAVTDQNGDFTIKNAPTGVEVRVIAWHEVAKEFYGGKEGEKKTFKKGDNDLGTLKVKAP